MKKTKIAFNTINFMLYIAEPGKPVICCGQKGDWYKSCFTYAEITEKYNDFEFLEW